jgi:hypothetical protein
MIKVRLYGSLAVGFPRATRRGLAISERGHVPAEIAARYEAANAG